MKDWQRLQSDLYESAHKEVKNLLQKKSKALQNYERRYRRDLSSLKPSSTAALLRQLQKTDILFIGDFHTLKQSQKTLLRLLRDKEIPKPKVLALEAVSPELENEINRWIAKPSPIKLKKIEGRLQIEKRFGSSWEIYKEIFKACKNHRIKIKGLWTKSTHLETRDQFAVDQLCTKQTPTWVLFGEYHCARPHLPRLFSEKNNTQSLLVLQQNIDREKGRRLKSPVLVAPKRYGINLFCLMHTPSWLKWQSYLNHLHYSDSASLELHAQDQIEWCLQTLYEFLEDSRYPFAFTLKELLDLSIYAPNDESFYESLKSLRVKKRRHTLEILKHKSMAILPEEKQIYLKEVTMNSCAEASGSYLYQTWSGKAKVGFYGETLNECMAYFLSKLLNHSRKAPIWKDWERLARQSNPKKLFAKKVLQSQNFSMAFDPKITKRLQPYTIETQQALGRIIAESLFEAFLVGEFSLSRLLRIMCEPRMSEPHSYETLIELKSIGHPFRSQDRRFW